MKILLYFVLFCCLTHNVWSEKFRFDNYTLYKVQLESREQVKLLKDLQNNDFRYDFWSEPTLSVGFVQIMTDPENKNDLQNFFTQNNINAEVSMSNVQEFIDKQTVKHYTRSNTRSMTWDAYYELDDIYAWMEDLAKLYPDVATEVVGGVTYEGREIKGIKISHGEGKRNIFIEGGIHAREWISPPTVCYIISELLTSDDPETMAAARDFDWHIFPVTNPDGYVFTHDSFRMWRKNRRPFANGIGVDLNRNWNSNWLAYGASINPASDIYAGPGPFSEPETRSMARYIREIGDKMEVFLTFHSFGQMLLLPFGNTSEPLANYHEAMSIGIRSMGALSVKHGTEYVTGNIVEILFKCPLIVATTVTGSQSHSPEMALPIPIIDYNGPSKAGSQSQLELGRHEATGGTDEWVKEQFNVPLVYCYELRDRFSHGFLLPPEQILPNNEEVMDSVIEMIHQGKRFGVIRTTSSGVGLRASVLLILGAIFAYFL